jgi:transmembrane sensor
MNGSGFDKEKVLRYFRGNSSENDESYTAGVFCDNTNEKELKVLLSGQFDNIPDNEKDEKDLDHILYKIHYHINTTKETESQHNTLISYLKWPMRIAGVIIFALAIFWGISGQKKFNDALASQVEIKAPAWTRARFTLPDGSTGWLNSSSSLTYSMNFKENRNLTLDGEAFFDVVRNEENPFTVATDEVTIKVLGTRFNVAAYKNEKNIEVVLEKGSVELIDNEENNSLKLSPDELAVFDKTSNSFVREAVETRKYLSWTEGKLVFRNDPMEVIARRLERWYNIEVEITGKIHEDFRLRATFVDESLEDILEILKKSFSIDYFIINPDIKPDETYPKKKVKISFRN